MKPLGIASTLAIACVAVLANQFGAGGAARRRRTVYQPGLLVLSGRRQACRPNSRNDPSMIVMSLAVDYWDYLGWKDTLALSGHTNRQRAYARARGDREVYTPQVVVNGVAHVLGSDKAAIEKAIRKTRDTASAAVASGHCDDRGRQGHGERAGLRRTRSRRARSGCARSRSKVPVTIGRGENHGQYDHLHQRGAPLGQARRLDRQSGNLQRCR